MIRAIKSIGTNALILFLWLLFTVCPVVAKITDAKLNDTVFRYSGSEGNGIDQLVGVYDANVAKNTPLDSQPHTAYLYGKLGRLDTETDPIGKRIHYTYYDNGMVKEKYDATNSTPGTLLVTYTYNNRGQITDKTFTDGTYEHYTYTANGQLETAGNQNISYTYAYYNDGRLQSVTDTTNKAIKKPLTAEDVTLWAEKLDTIIIADMTAEQKTAMCHEVEKLRSVAYKKLKLLKV